MMKPRDPDALLRAYLAGGMDVLSDRVVESVLDEVHRTRQRATFPWKRPTGFRSAFGAAAVVVMVVLGGTILLWQGGRPAITEPSPTASESAGPSSRPTSSAAAIRAGSWVPVGRMATPRMLHTAVRLNDGRVLVVGGVNGFGENGYPPAMTAAEIYDPESGTWSAAGNMTAPADGFPATLLGDGRVLVGTEIGDDRWGADVYDPTTGTWSPTGPMAGGGSVATLLRDGTVLVTGDRGGELYDPDRGTWTSTTCCARQRHSHASVLLADGRVLIAGGHAPGDRMTETAELYDPATGSWAQAVSMGAQRESIGAFLRPDGRVLVIGGSYRAGVRSAELYDPVTGTWAATGETSNQGVPSNPVFTGLSDGTVLMTGDRLATLFDPESGRWIAAGTTLGVHSEGTATALSDGTVLVAGGGCPEADLDCVATGFAELYIPDGALPPANLATPGPSPRPTPKASPTPKPTPYAPAAGPVPTGGTPWEVTVVNTSSDPATLFVAEEDGTGMTRLVGSVTPNVVPADTTVTVTFRVPPGRNGWWIFINPGPRTGALLGPDDLPQAREIRIESDGQAGWMSR